MDLVFVCGVKLSARSECFCVFLSPLNPSNKPVLGVMIIIIIINNNNKCNNWKNGIYVVWLKHLQTWSHREKKPMK